MKTTKLTLTLTGILVVIAVTTLVWQQHRLAQSQADLERLRSETAQLATMREKLTHLKHLEVDQAELARLRQVQATSRVELAKLRGQASGALRAEAEASRLRSELERQTAQGTNGTNPVSSAMSEAMKGSVQQMFQRRLSRMQEKLSLSPNQTQAIQEILTRQGNRTAEAMQKVFAGKLNRDELAKLREGTGNPEAEIQALLSPEQGTAYAAFKDEEAANSARVAANGELLQMQIALSLTPEQQDKVFGVLYDQTLAQFKMEATRSSGANPANPAEVMQAMLDQKLRALEGVLTPTQLEGYREQQERQIKLMKGLVSQTEQPAARP